MSGSKSNKEEESALLKLIKLYVEEYNLAENARVEASNRMDAVLALYCELRKGEDDPDITVRTKDILTDLTRAADSRRRILKDLVNLDIYKVDNLRQLQERAQILLDGEDYGRHIVNPPPSP